MGNNLTKSQKFGIQWRWLFLVGGVIYAINTLTVLFAPQEVYSFLGLEMSRWLYFSIQLAIAAWLVVTFVRNHKLFRQETFRHLTDEEQQGQSNENENV
ncbi:MAG: hypothetical protein ACJAXX_000282 [Roseivirga sp.]|jgi:hypothetical protein